MVNNHLYIQLSHFDIFVKKKNQEISKKHKSRPPPVQTTKCMQLFFLPVTPEAIGLIFSKVNECINYCNHQTKDHTIMSRRHLG